MNKISQKMWQILAKVKLDSNSFITKYNAILLLGEFGGSTDIHKLLPLLDEEDTILRNATVQSLKRILTKLEAPSGIFEELVELFNDAELIKKLAIIEVFSVFDLNMRESVLGPLLSSSSGELVFSILRSLRGTKDRNLLDAMLDISDTNDSLLKRLAYSAWFEGLSKMEPEERVEYGTPLLHSLIRATYEMRDVGNVLQHVLSNANKKKLPPAKAYPEFITRYLISLINRWEYDPDIYRTLHSLMVPAYFTFKDESGEAPFIRV